MVGSSRRVLGNVESLFMAITPLYTLILSGYTCKDSINGSNGNIQILLILELSNFVKTNE